MFENIFTPLTNDFIIKIILVFIAGFIVGAEREARGKIAGISTHIFVIGGAMFFTFLSPIADPTSPARLTAQIVTGIGFLGAGIILKFGKDQIRNLTTAASIWFSAALGIAIGMGFYTIAIIATFFSFIVPRMPHFTKKKEHHDR